MNAELINFEPLPPVAGSVLPRCPACGRKPKLYVSMTCNQPDWWHASIRCPLPCHAVRDAGDERREIAIKEATHAWSSYSQNDKTVPTEGGEKTL
jgi:hypothetical protein